MKKLLCVAIAIALCVVSALTALAVTNEEAQSIADSVTQTTTDKSQVTSPFISVIASVQDSVVGVNNYQNYTYYSPSNSYGFGSFWGYGNGRNSYSTETVEKLAASGSGVVVYENIVITNYHVVEDAVRLSVSVTNEEKEYEATLINYDEAADIAVLYVPELQLPAVPLGDSDSLQVGEWAICIGNPLSDELRGTVTTGIISALDREIKSTTSTDKYGLKTNTVNTMIQTNAAINSGNSGGGMFNILGQLVGIPSMKLSTSSSSSASIEGIGFAVPINSAKSLINEAIVKVLTGSTTTSSSASTATASQNESGQKPTLGVTVSSITSSNNSYVYYGILPSGLMLQKVTENSPASAAGLKPYDIIVEANGTITTSVTALHDILATLSYGDTISIKVYRVDGIEDAFNSSRASDIGTGEYIDIDVQLFEYNTAA